MIHDWRSLVVKKESLPIYSIRGKPSLIWNFRSALKRFGGWRQWREYRRLRNISFRSVQWVSSRRDVYVHHDATLNYIRQGNFSIVHRIFAKALPSDTETRNISSVKYASFASLGYYRSSGRVESVFCHILTFWVQRYCKMRTKTRTGQLQGATQWIPHSGEHTDMKTYALATHLVNQSVSVHSMEWITFFEICRRGWLTNSFEYRKCLST